VDGLSGARVEDAGGAQAAARRYLVAQFGQDKILDVSFSKVWFSTGTLRDVWEVEGNLVVRKRWIDKDHLHFKFQIDPETGRVIAYEV